MWLLRPMKGCFQGYVCWSATGTHAIKTPLTNAHVDNMSSRDKESMNARLILPLSLDCLIFPICKRIY